ncbi:VPA1267 family protein [Vibrio breoganii]|uniref:VPA1267 family protein n=1 Tax=Vibrio breoganii TaxID=553239 RepID=UPI000C817C7D|nr:VPA1267 family protein [Vibrio breoganii]PMJ44057.1 hypothetical protein BCU21_16545 [Vibrio breoganii]PMK60542.1 hypothetical protein BCT97_05515 [Vibrio breoganii]PMO27512.1 hypothetical protein BCT14_11970 [Vibrio breoganii]PMO30356.1 hypothetical protein BCT13_13830 [Vibrio breoganii]PMO66706.1 hypothetical protein BCT05_08355 [Vibrio breoganii]
MANGQQVAQENLNKFEAWKATKSDDDYKNMVYRGKLHRTELAKQTGIGKSAFNQNPALAEALEDLETYLRECDILPKVSKQSTSQASDKAPPMRDMNASKLRILERENNKLRAEVLELKAKLSRYSELEEVVSALGNIL